MKRVAAYVRGLGMRAAWAALCLLFAFGLLIEPSDSLLAGVGNSLFGCVFFVLAGFILAPSLSRAMARELRLLILRQRHPDEDKTPPLYGWPAALAARGHFEEAMTAYEDLLRKHPDVPRLYTEAIDLAVVRLRDGARAEAIYRRGLAALRDEGDRKALTGVYEAVRTRLDSGPRWRRDQGNSPLHLP